MDFELLYFLMFAFEQRRSLSDTTSTSVRTKNSKQEVKDLQKECSGANGSYMRIV
jgi:hypothetical protein